MADRILSPRTINFDGRRSSWVRKLTMYTLATAGAKITRKAGESKKRKIQPQEVEEDFIPVASIRSVGLKRSKSTS
jgi:hypothetical protein